MNIQKLIDSIPKTKSDANGYFWMLTLGIPSEYVVFCEHEKKQGKQFIVPINQSLFWVHLPMAAWILVCKLLINFENTALENDQTLFWEKGSWKSAGDFQVWVILFGCQCHLDFYTYLINRVPWHWWVGYHELYHGLLTAILAKF